jgi:hypothetical protein
MTLYNDIISANQTTVEDVKTVENELDFEGSMIFLGFMAVLLIILFGMIEMGSSWGIMVANKLGLYTNFDLERAESDLKKIKEVLK